MAENQADADPNTSMKDRLKMAGGDVVTGVADTVDNPVVSVAANVAKVSNQSIYMNSVIVLCYITLA